MAGYCCSHARARWLPAKEHDETSQNAAAEIAGNFFTSFEIVDLVLGSLHGLMDKEYVIHHLLHIVLGILIRGLCSLAPIAGAPGPCTLACTSPHHTNAKCLSCSR